MLLAIDAGNTNIVFGVHDGQSWLYHWRVRTVRDKMPDEYGVLLQMLLNEAELSLQSFDRIVIGSVVPPLTGRLEELCAERARVTPLIVNSSVQTGLKFAVDNPAEVGADLIADAVAAYHLFQSACMVVDFGTATTFTAVSATAEFLGVAIAPGINLAASALAGGTAQLPHVRLVAPPRVIGTNTTHAIQSGILYGYVSLVEGMVKRFQTQMAQTLQVVATGGLASTIAPLTECFTRVDPWLTLDGIRLIGERNL